MPAGRGHDLVLGHIVGVAQIVGRIGRRQGVVGQGLQPVAVGPLAQHAGGDLGGEHGLHDGAKLGATGGLIILCALVSVRHAVNPAVVDADVEKGVGKGIFVPYVAGLLVVEHRLLHGLAGVDHVVSVSASVIDCPPILHWLASRVARFNIQSLFSGLEASKVLL